jgi:hypothetical protein
MKGYKNRLWLISVASVALVLTLALAMAQEGRQPAWGTIDSPNASGIQFEAALAAVQASHTFTEAQYGAGGVGLRNRATGGIGISGVLTPVKGAFIYWAAITEGSPTAANKSIKVQRLFPTPASAVVTITGTAVGTGASPCWPGNTITVWKGSVPTAVATGNGLYQVTVLPGASGTTGGADPWVSKVDPLMEGASIVIVGTGSSTVALYDSGLAGKTFATGGLTYSLTLPKPTGATTLWDDIGADGQIGKSRLAKSGDAEETTTINGVLVAGPGAPYYDHDSDWNGSVAKPLPQLWDDTGHDISEAAPSGTTTLSVAISPTDDCLTPVANVVEE